MTYWSNPIGVSLAILYLLVSGVCVAEDPAALRRAAKQGDVVAQYRLGWMHSAGRGVERNNKKAAKLLRRAADGGHPTAQADLGFFYAQGRGDLDKDPAIAREWFRKSLAGGLVKKAEQGDVFAQTSLGRMYANGAGCRKQQDAVIGGRPAQPRCVVEKDAKQAAEWFRRAAERGHGDAQGRLGAAYLTGTGVPQDAGKAAEWLRRAAERGEPGAQFLLGQLYLHGQGVPKDIPQGAVCLRKADERGVRGIRQAMNLLEK